MFKRIISLFLGLGISLTLAKAEIKIESGIGTLVYTGGEGPGAGKHVVLLAGDEEYRSEEAMPVLARILCENYGFDATVLFSADEDGTINPQANDNLMGSEALDKADLIIMSLRFRNWQLEAMKDFDEAIQRGTPVIGLRTSTHAFKLEKDSPYFKYHWRSEQGGFGRVFLGETWISHWGNHKREATRAVIEKGQENNPILNNVGEIFADSDVYEAYPPEDATILMRGLVLENMEPNSAPATRRKVKPRQKLDRPINDPAMPVAWTREVTNESGNKNKVVTATFGAMTDLMDEDARRFVVNGAFWALNLEIPEKAKVDLPEGFKATPFKNGGHVAGKKAIDFAK